MAVATRGSASPRGDGEDNAGTQRAQADTEQAAQEEGAEHAAARERGTANSPNDEYEES